jgi:hypothetical protein
VQIRNQSYSPHMEIKAFDDGWEKQTNKKRTVASLLWLQKLYSLHVWLGIITKKNDCQWAIIEDSDRKPNWLFVAPLCTCAQNHSLHGLIHPHTTLRIHIEAQLPLCTPFCTCAQHHSHNFDSTILTPCA